MGAGHEEDPNVRVDLPWKEKDFRTNIMVQIKSLNLNLHHHYHQEMQTQFEYIAEMQTAKTKISTKIWYNTITKSERGTSAHIHCSL